MMNALTISSLTGLKHSLSGLPPILLVYACSKFLQDLALKKPFFKIVEITTHTYFTPAVALMRQAMMNTSGFSMSLWKTLKPHSKNKACNRVFTISRAAVLLMNECAVKLLRLSEEFWSHALPSEQWCLSLCKIKYR